MPEGGITKSRGRPKKNPQREESNAPKRKLVGIDNAGKRRAVTQSEQDPFAHTPETINMSPVLSNDWCQMMLGDCHDVLSTIPSGSVNLVYTDPPFAQTMAVWDEGLKWRDVIFPQLWRILVPGGAVVIHAAQPFLYELVASQREHFKYAWTWVKNNKTLFPKCKVQPLRQVEQICVFYKSQCTYNPQMVKGKPHMRGNPGHSQYYGDAFKKNGSSIHDTYYPTDCIQFPLDELLQFLTKEDIKNFPFEQFAQYLRDSKKELSFPTELLNFHVRGGRSFSRTEVMAEYFIRTYSNPGDVVLDFCCSDGTSGAACRNTERKFIGCDKSPPHYRLACKRLGLVEENPQQVEENIS